MIHLAGEKSSLFWEDVFQSVSFKDSIVLSTLDIMFSCDYMISD